jgi:hypothetical protein
MKMISPKKDRVMFMVKESVQEELRKRYEKSNAKDFNEFCTNIISAHIDNQLIIPEEKSVRKIWKGIPRSYVTWYWPLSLIDKFYEKMGHYMLCEERDQSLFIDIILSDYLSRGETYEVCIAKANNNSMVSPYQNN